MACYYSPTSPHKCRLVDAVRLLSASGGRCGEHLAALPDLGVPRAHVGWDAWKRPVSRERGSMKALFLGDSVTAGWANDDVSDGWPHLFAARSGWEITNLAVGGSPLHDPLQ